MSDPIKLSSSATREFWEIAVLWEDAHVLALDKPAGLLTSPDRADPERPSLMAMLHAGIKQGKPWAQAHGLNYLVNAHRLDRETSGVLLLARSKPVLVALANLFGANQPVRIHLALVQGTPANPQFSSEARLAPHPVIPGRMRVDSRHGKRSCTQFEVAERFRDCTLLRCRPLTERMHQIRVHLQHAGHPVVGDGLYGGSPLLLSRLKPGYRLKPRRTERPLISQAALHAERLELAHPVTGALLAITAPWPKDLAVALKYLRRYAAVEPAPGPEFAIPSAGLPQSPAS